MKDFGKVIFITSTKAYIINNGTYAVPSPDDKSVPEVIHKEFDELYKEIQDYAKQNPSMVTSKPVLTYEG